ncbi:hypothetical protein [Flavobacterium sp.]|uniref:hypothetical protein n=1 Tax=Flavobacterium sp. TaxID=239 RepID=UPI0035B2B5D9
MKTKFTLLISMVILTVAFNQAKAQDKVVAKSGKLVTVNSDAAAGTKGIIQLAGDLGGTAASPTVPGLALKAPIAGPVFTGDAQATTAAVGDSDTSVATTAFVATAVTNGVAAGAPDATNLVKGKVQLAGDLGGTAAAPTITNAAVIGKVLTGYTSTAGTITATDNIVTAIGKLNGNDALKAPIAGPVFTGDAQATTAAVGDSDTSVATTAFVATAVTNGVAAGAPDATNLVKGKVQLAGDLGGTAAAPTITNAAVIGKVLTGYTSTAGTITATDNIVTAIGKLNGNDALKAPINNPTFTGTPTLPTGTIGVTQSAGNNTTALATTAFVTTAVANGVAAGAVTSAQEEITATANQTSFTAVNVPKTNSLIFYINGVKVPMSAITISGTPAKTITYNPVNNDNYSISLNDVITLAYLY